MKTNGFRFGRIAAAGVLLSVFSFASVWTSTSAREQAEDSVAVFEQSSNEKTPAPVAALNAERRGFPLINLQDGKRVKANFAGPARAVRNFGAARPLTMIDGDLNLDGAADLAVGYASGDSGHLAIYTGNPETLSARTPESFEAMKEGRFPEPFLPDTRLIALPIAPDFVGIGDFNRDGWKDIAAAQRGTHSLVLLAGNAKGNYKQQNIELPGTVGSFLAGNIDPADNQADVAVAVSDANGSWLLVFDDQQDVFGGQPRVYPMPGEATSLALGQLDDDFPKDILAAAGGRAVVVHGSFPDASASELETAETNAGQVELLNAGADVAAVRVGNFVWDRENLSEVALLSQSGSVHILERDDLDKRTLSEKEMKMRWRRHREEMEKQDAVRELSYKPLSAKTVQRRWSETDNFQIAAPLGADRASSTTAFFTSARMSPLGVEDLLVVDANSRKVHVLVSNDEELQKSGEFYALSASGTRAAVTFDSEASPVAALPMRLSVMNRPGIVFLDRESRDISYSLAAPAVTFTVTKTADTYDGTCAADCSFREALQAANATAASDVIMVPAGTYTINTALGGPDQDTTIDPAAQQSGDWDVFFDTTITGAGQATTILQAAAAQPGHDRVLDAIQTGVGIPDLTISGVTIRNGRCRADLPCVDGGGLRYAVDNQSLLTISDSTITANRTEVNTASPANNGGGIFGGQSDFNYTNVTVTNNFTAFVSGGCTGATQCGGEGGGIFSGIRFTANPTSVTMTNCTITGNTVNAVNGLGGRGGAYAGSPDSVSITGGTFNSNIAFTDAGALRLFTPTTINGATISNNTARQNGGGIWSDPLANDNTPLTNTFTNVIMRGNTADSDGVIAVNNVNRGDGGAIFHGRGTLNLNNPTIGGIGAGEGNTAFDGGGIARTYSQFTSAIFNASTLNINSGGSIVGNLAINNGGGIVNDATKSAAAGNASTLNMTGGTAVTFTNNNARNHGGGIAVITNAGSSGPAAAANLNNMTLRNNAANSDASGGGDGGALYQSSGNVAGGGTAFTGTLSIGGSGFANSAVNGGGISNALGSLTLPANASITFNTATGNGGGINNGGTIGSFSTAVISNNSATTSGGGIFNAGTITVSGATISSNAAATGSSVTQSAGTFTTAGTNTFGGNVAITGGTFSSVGTNTITGNFTQTGGTFNGNASTVNLAGNFSFAPGTFTAGTSTFNFNGSSAQTITGTVTFNNLTVNNPLGVSLLSNETVGGALTLTSGVLAVGSNTLTLNGAVSATAGSLSSNANGTVNYNQGSAGQSVLAANYGNLTFSNFNKTLPAAIVGIAGTFTPGTAVGHTVTGNTISFNGTALQTIPPVFPYNNLTLNNAVGANLGGNVTVNGALALQAGNLGVVANTLTLNGATSSTGGTLSSAANGTVNYNQGSNGQAVLSGTYGNLTFSNFQKNLTNASVGVAGTFTTGAGGGHTVTGSTFTFNGAAAQTLPSGFTTYNNLTLNNTAGVTGFAGLTVQGLLRVQAGTFTSSSTYNNVQIDAGATLAGVNATTINVSGNWTNNGAFTANGNTVNFNGAALQTIGGTSTTTFNNLTINNAAGVNLGGNATVNGALTLTAGALGVGTSTLTLNAGTSGAGTLTSSATGTVVYNQVAVGQVVRSANYGNLTFSNSNKVLTGANIGVAGTFTPGTAVGHTITGSTFDFNGAGTQTVPVFSFNNLTVSGARGGATVTLASGAINVAGTFNPIAAAVTYAVTGNTFTFNGPGAQTIPAFTFNNLSTATSGTKSLVGNAAALGSLTVAAGTTLDCAGFNLGVGGNLVINGVYTCAAGTTTINGSAAQTINSPAPLTFNNLTINNPAGVTLGLGATVNGLLTFTAGELSTGANTLSLGSSAGTSRTSGHLVGTLAKTFGATGPFTFPVGTVGAYSPVIVEVTSTSGGTLSVRANTGTVAPLVPATTLQRFWTLNGGGITANVTFNYLQTDVAGNENDYRTIRVQGGAPISFGNDPACPGANGAICVNPTANTIFVSGLDSFSDWTAGQLAPTAAGVTVSGVVADQYGRGIYRTVVTITDPATGQTRHAMTNNFGRFRFADVPAGGTVAISVAHNRYVFERPTQLIQVVDNVSGVTFTGSIR